MDAILKSIGNYEAVPIDHLTSKSNEPPAANNTSITMCSFNISYQLCI